MKPRVRSPKKKPAFVSGRRLVKFPLVKGKTLEEVEFSTNAEDHSITLVFSDQTMLHLEIEPGFSLFADHAEVKNGDLRIIRRWRPVRSRLFRE